MFCKVLEKKKREANKRVCGCLLCCCHAEWSEIFVVYIYGMGGIGRKRRVGVREEC